MKTLEEPQRQAAQPGGLPAASGYVPTVEVCSLHMAHDGTAAARAWCAQFRAAMCEMMDEWTADNPCPVQVAINIALLRDDSYIEVLFESHEFSPQK